MTDQPTDQPNERQFVSKRSYTSNKYKFLIFLSVNVNALIYILSIFINKDDSRYFETFNIVCFNLLYQLSAITLMR